MTISVYEETKEALRQGDSARLELLLEEDFNEKIDPLELGAKSYREIVEQKRRKEPEIILVHPSGSRIYEDRTDYILPYLRGGFLRRDQSGIIAAYGILDEIYVFERKVVEPAHHFFFMSEQPDDMLELLISKAKDSPGNPAKIDTVKYSPAHLAMPFFLGLNMAEAAIYFGFGINDRVPINVDQGAIAGIVIGLLNFAGGYYLGKSIFDRKSQRYSGKSARSSLWDSTYGARGLKKYLREKAI